MRDRVRPLTAFLRQHPLLVLGPLFLLAITVALWSLPTWPLTAFAILRQHAVFILAGGLSFAL
jgi:hypothetical protein